MEKCKNCQFWPFDDFLPIHYHIKLHKNKGSGDKSPIFGKTFPTSSILNKFKLATLVLPTEFTYLFADSVVTDIKIDFNKNFLVH